MVKLCRRCCGLKVVNRQRPAQHGSRAAAQDRFGERSDRLAGRLKSRFAAREKHQGGPVIAERFYELGRGGEMQFARLVFSEEGGGSV